MKAHLLRSPLLLALTLALALAGPARADDSTNSIAFSDPSKPGTLRVRVWHGDVTIHGEDVKEISVKSESQVTSPTPRKDGMRVLSASANYTLSEKGNVASLDYGSDGWSGSGADFDITVPRSTSIVVANLVHGDLGCSDVSGDIDVRATHGDVTLDGVSGGALVETVNGEIKVTVKALVPDKPLSFTSMNGQVTLHVPADLKAAIRFRTHRGVILTNFDDKALVTKTEISKAHAAPGTEVIVHNDGRDRSDSDDDIGTQVRDSIREAAETAREAIRAAHEEMAEAHIELSGSLDAPMPPLPPMTGGKTVSGALNGGGVEIQAATLNGDIILKKIE